MARSLKDDGSPPLPIYFKDWRDHHGLTIEAVADLTGVSIATVQRMEKGDSNFDAIYLKLFTKALKCPLPGDPVNRPPTQSSVDAVIMNACPNDRPWLTDRAIALVQDLIKNPK